MSCDPFQEAPPIIREFLGYIGTIKGKSPKTVSEYYLDLRTFFRYMKLKRGLVPKDVDFEQIKIDDIDLDFIKTIDLTQVFEYMNFLATERKNGVATRSRKVSSLRSFFNYLTNKTGKLSKNPVQELETPKLKKALPKYLTLEQCLELLSKIDGKNRERDYCIITLFLNCGMRLSELVNLDLNDVHFSTQTIKITGKGNKERMVYLNDACIDALKKYLAVRPRDGVIDKKALFISGQRKRISAKTVQYIVKKYLAQIDLGGPGYSVHKLRHTAATLMYQHGHVDIRILKDILGHENLGTTEIYTHVSNEQMAKAAKSNPLSGVKQKRREKSDE
ncbi:MAG: Recombinase XerC [Thermocaproicibacter melissae]|jgi:site-specific recombinase XerD|uniref:tyrosine recombinase XerC n=1 Tax=Thermocaproicibacter melissae TaxID=2966552 RepID=UPI0024B15A94|nr:tyrosine recombinase XerC [Thermocaproicibacter melissae]WBY64790.1 tyrosine recombinase XerC [Thermocaproicibacter melissae]